MAKTSASPTRASWRSSTSLTIFTATLGLFTENFLYGFVIPIMAYMFEIRLHQSPELTQRYTSSMLFIMGFFSVFAAPVIGHFADQTPSRKIPLLISLAGCTLGTALVAATPSVAVVFVGRLLQGVAGTGAWIVSFAMLTDSIDKKHFGKTLGFASSFVTAGVLTGPAVAGSLLEWLGYWPAWTVPFALLGIDLIARLVMVEEKKAKTEDKEHQESQETTSLLNENEPTSEGEAPKAAPVNALTFYRIMLSQPPVLAGLANVITFSLMVAAFDATFPLHLRSVFHWGPAPIGLIFLGIQIPAMIFAPVIGWLRDRVGLKWPTALGWLLMAPIMWFLGVPGKWEVPGLKGDVAFVVGIVVLGCVSPLSRGAGTFAMSATLRELQEKDPAIFGPHGGSSRMFSMTEVAFSTGLMLGPVVGGAISDTIGFYFLMCLLAALCVLVSITSAIFLPKSGRVRVEEEWLESN